MTSGLLDVGRTARDFSPCLSTGPLGTLGCGAHAWFGGGMRPRWEQDLIRSEVFHWLSELRESTGRHYFWRSELYEFEFRGERIPLLDGGPATGGRGIRNPRGFEATLSLMTSADTRRNPYEDIPLGDGMVRYHYQATDGGDNRKLRAAAELRVPIVYFEQKHRAGPFYAHYPMFVQDDPGTRTVTLAFDEDIRFQIELSSLPPEERRYVERKALLRLHQGRFRDIVMAAYEERCSVCNLGHARLLDAAHITPDADLEGIVHVTNGLALCKIHHTAYDQKLMGIDPDFVVHINRDLLAEVDGPMLEHGLKQMHGERLRKVPERARDWPDRDRLAARFEQFVA